MDDLNHDENFEGEEDDIAYQLTPAGYRRIFGWVRFQTQLCEMEHGEESGACDDETHEIAFMLTFLIVPIMEALGIEIEDTDDGDA